MHWTLPEPAERTLGHLLRFHANRIGDSDFIVDSDERHSYSQFNSAVNDLAAGLKMIGVTRADAVACYLDNSPDTVALQLALGKIGAVFVPTNLEFRGDFLLRTFTQGAGHTLFVEEDLVARVAEIWAKYAFKTVIVRGDPTEAQSVLTGARVLSWDELPLAGSGEPNELVDVRPSDLAAVMWTSGTTGPPKGVMQTHNLWIASADFMLRTRGVREDDRFFNFLPLYQSGSWLMNIYPALLSGLPAAMDRRFSVGSFWDRCRFYGATQFLTLGAMHIYLWQAPARDDDRDNPVRVASCIPMPVAIHQPFMDRFGIEFICQGFGQSECMPVAMTNPTRNYKPNSCGTPRAGLEVRILDDDDREVSVDEPGEICVRPAEPGVIFSGFYRDDAATVKAWRNLWYHTGDLGRIDQDGELFFVDRKADFMRHKGRNISSFEVESVANKHPTVLESAAHGVPADELSVEDEIKLCVVLAPNSKTTPAEIAQFVLDNAPSYMAPRYVEIFDDLPHTPTGRVQKYLLRRLGITEQTWDRKSSA